MDLERELKAALRRREAPPGFAGRVLARVEAEPRPHGWWSRLWPRPLVMRWALAGGLAGLLLVGGAGEYRRRQGEIAKARVVLALHIAGAKLNYAQRKVQEARLPAELLEIGSNEVKR
jgi:hypothetical protein